MATKKIWVIEEIEVNGQMTQRQSFVTCDDNPEGWHWNRPDERLNDAGRAEWNRVMEKLKNVGGEDLRHVVCGVGLLDHCLGGSRNYVP